MSDPPNQAWDHSLPSPFLHPLGPTSPCSLGASPTNTLMPKGSVDVATARGILEHAKNALQKAKAKVEQNFQLRGSMSPFTFSA